MILAALSLLVGGGSAAQPQPVVERVDVARVIIDVRVVDDDGQPIRGLEPDDFEVRIDDEPVRVESAFWVGDEAGNDDSSGAPIESTEIAGFLEPEDRSQLIVFVVQKSLESSRALGLLRLLMHSERLLSRVTPADRVAVLSFDSHLKIWVDFTDDLERVGTVLADEIMFGRPPVLEPQGELSLLTTLSQDAGRRTWEFQEALRLLGEALEPLPGSKSVVLIGYGFGQLTVSLGMVGFAAGRPLRRGSRRAGGGASLGLHARRYAGGLPHVRARPAGGGGGYGRVLRAHVPAAAAARD